MKILMYNKSEQKISECVDIQRMEDLLNYFEKKLPKLKEGIRRRNAIKKISALKNRLNEI